MKLSYFFGTECRKWTLGVSTCYFFCYCFATRGWSIWSKRNFPLGNFLYWNFHSYNLNGNEIFCHETHNEVVEFSLREFSVMEYFIFHGIFFFPRIKIFSFMELLSNGIVFQGIFCHGIIFSWNSLFLGIKIFSWNFQIHGKSFSWNLFSWNFLFPGIKIFSFMELMSTGIVIQGIFCHGIFFSWNSLFLGISYFHEIFKFMENLFHEICFHGIFFVEFSFL